MPNGSHSSAYPLPREGETIADTVTNPAYRKAAFALMMQEQAPTLSMPEGTDPERLPCDAADRAFQQPVSASPYLADCDGRQPEVTAASAGPGASAPAKRRQLASPGAGRGWLDALHPGAWMSRVMPLTWSTRCWRSSRRSTRSIRRRPRESAAGPERYFCR